MCSLVEEYAREVAAEAVAEATAEAKKAANKAAAEAKKTAKRAAAEADAKRIIGAVESCSAALNFSLEQACSTVGISIGDYRAAKELIGKQYA